MTALHASEDPGPNIFDGISKVMRVYMALNGIRHQKEVGVRLGWSESKTTRKFQGRWSLDDLPELASLTGLSASDLVGDADEAVRKLQSSCFAAISLVEDVLGQRELPFGSSPELVLVGSSTP